MGENSEGGAAEQKGEASRRKAIRRTMPIAACRAMGTSTAAPACTHKRSTTLFELRSGGQSGRSVRRRTPQPRTWVATLAGGRALRGCQRLAVLHYARRSLCLLHALPYRQRVCVCAQRRSTQHAHSHTRARTHTPVSARVDNHRRPTGTPPPPPTHTTHRGRPTPVSTAHCLVGKGVSIYTSIHPSIPPSIHTCIKDCREYVFIRADTHTYMNADVHPSIH